MPRAKTTTKKPAKKVTRRRTTRKKVEEPTLTREQELNKESRCAKCAKVLPEGRLTKNDLLYCSPACTT